MTNTLVSPTELGHLPGAPFTAAEVDGAVATLRTAVRWHIAPVLAETAVPFDVVVREPRLRLPTRKLVSVEEIRDVSGDTPKVVDPARYRVSRARAVVKKKSGFWPDGYEAVEVDFTHGYSKTPLELLAVVAEAVNLGRRDQSTVRISVDDFTQSWGHTSAGKEPLSTSAILTRYLWPEFPGFA